MAADTIDLVLKNDAGSTLHTFSVPKNKLDATAAPGVGDDDADGYVAGSLWMDRTNDKGYLCTDNATGAAVWVQIAGAGAGGSISDGDKGDITVSSSGTVWTIDNDVVTYAKMQNVSATDKLLGRSSSGSGDVEEIPCTAFARSILDDVDAAAVRATIGAGTGSGSGTVTSVATGSGLTGGTITGSGTISLDINGTTALTAPLNDDAAIIYDDSAAANRKVQLRYLIALFGTYITPIGSVLPFAGASIPSSFLECDGSAVSRTTYAGLFTAIGTTWGVGDGSTTFNLPDFRGRDLIGAGTGSGLTARTLGTTGGAETVTLAASEIPAHKHQVKSPNGSTMYKTGGGAANNVLSVASVGIGAAYETEDNSGGGGAHANMQPWAAVKWMIRHS